MYARAIISKSRRSKAKRSDVIADFQSLETARLANQNIRSVTTLRRRNAVSQVEKKPRPACLSEIKSRHAKSAAT